LTREYSSTTERLEVDSANATRDIPRQQGIYEAAIEVIRDAIAFHTTSGLPRHENLKREQIFAISDVVAE